MSENKTEGDDNIILFPLLKKSPDKISLDNLEVSRKDVDKITKHYITQLALSLKNHNIHMDTNFEKDFAFVFEALKSSILRSVGKHSPLQDYVDHINSLDIEKDKV